MDTEKFLSKNKFLASPRFVPGQLPRNQVSYKVLVNIGSVTILMYHQSAKCCGSYSSIHHTGVVSFLLIERMLCYYMIMFSLAAMAWALPNLPCVGAIPKNYSGLISYAGCYDAE